MNLTPVQMGSRVIKRQKPLLKGTDVRRLQQILKHLGFFNSRVDGVFGENTEIAVRCFQKAFARNPTGIVDDTTISILKHLAQSNLGNWVTFQRNFAHTGHSEVRIPIELKLSEAKKISEIISINFYGDKLVVTAAGGIYAFDYRFRNIVWENTQIKPKGHSTISDYRIFTPSGDIAVIDMFSGSVKKMIDVSKFTLPVAMSEGVMYASSDTGILYAFDQNHTVLWKYRVDGTLSPPAIGYDNIYFASSNGSIYCLDGKGVLNWKVKIADIVKHPMCIYDGKIFAIGYGTGIYAINPLTGDMVWKRGDNAGELMPPAFHGDLMLIVDDMCRVSAISTQRPETKWTLALGALPSTPPIICHNTALFGTDDGLIVYDLSRGEQKKYLEGRRIRVLAQACFDIYVASDSKLLRLSPKIGCL
jgi:outer membrane protein assembly factor BamB